MSQASLHGPVAPDAATRYLNSLRAAGECRTFGPVAGDGIDFVVPTHAAWADLVAQFPDGWRPDFVALHLAYAPLPAWVGEAPVPVVGLAPDWNLLWETYRRTLPLCDLVLTDTTGVAALRAAGLQHVEPAILFGGSDTWLPATPPDAPRDLDLTFCGNVHPAVTRDRLPFVGRLADFADRYRVSIGVGLPFPEYRALHQRSRVAFNPSARGEWNQRVCEAVLCGCLLVIEEDNVEVLEVLRPGVECLTFTPDNLDAVLADILADEPRRVQLARAAQERLGDPTFARFWREAVTRITPRLDALRSDRQQRVGDPVQVRRACVGAAFLAGRGDAPLLDEAVATYRPHAATPEAANDLALLYALPQANAASQAECVEQALRLFRQGLQRWPGHPLLAYNLVRLLLRLRDPGNAVPLARQALATLDNWRLDDAAAWDLTPWPLDCDEVWVEWQRAGWQHVGDPLSVRHARRELLRWFLYLVVGEAAEGGLVACYEAVRARPDLGRGRARLGLALARAGHHVEALPDLRAALAASPFDPGTAHVLSQVLGALGRQEELDRLRTRQRLLHRAAPGLVPAHAWFAPEQPTASVTPATTATPGVAASDTPGVTRLDLIATTQPTVAARPTGRELASIIIPCHNQSDYTRTCLESLLRCTRSPYEVIVIDNGSTDATAEVCAAFARHQGPARVEVVRNATNRGFGAACNQGIAAARGHYVVFLNNDTVVTPGWLDKLVSLSLHDFPKIGLTGPLSNRATPEQTIAVPYTDAAGLLPFAQELGRRNADHFRTRDRLSGVCLLARRAVLDQIGGFDEQFGLGYFEDDDLCLRARFAGYELAVALDAFIHHHGSQTSRNLGIDTEALLHANLERFKAKWRDRLPAGYRNCRLTALGTTLDQAEQADRDDLFARLPAEAQDRRDAVFSGTAAEFSGSIDISPLADLPDHLLAARHEAPAEEVSLCIIARDEEQNIADCIAPVRHLFGEVLVNDTGSKDRTVALARSLGARVIENPWRDSFCLGRNQCLDAATRRWIYWLDADDRMDRSEIAKLADLFRRLPATPLGVSMTCRCLGADGGVTDVNHLRLFPRRDDVRWSHRIHEQILPALRAIDAEILFRHDIVIRHTGYADPALRARKLERDLRLLLIEREELGDHPFTLFNIANVHLERGNLIEAAHLYQCSLQRCHPGDSIVRKLYAQLARCDWGLEQRQAALAHCGAGLRLYPRDDELLTLAANYRMDLGRLAEARQLYHELIEGQPDGNHFGSTVAGLRGHLAMHHLGVAYRRLGDLPRAEHWARRAVNERPEFALGWLALGDLLASQGRMQEAGAAAAHLEQLGRPGEAAALRGRTRPGA